MKEAIIAAVTKSRGRKRLFHFTRASNLPAIAYADQLYSSLSLDPAHRGTRRAARKLVSLGEYQVTLNAHLHIPSRMFDASVTPEQFRAALDAHIFLWPTVRDCLHMLNMYTRREPQEAFAVLAFDAHALLERHYEQAKLSKYDSGSAPRFPNRCAYRKSPDMFLPLRRFGMPGSPVVPATASEIREVLIEGTLHDVSGLLLTIYTETFEAVPARWRSRIRPLAELTGRVPEL